jgi:hypothetical protein
MRGIQILQTDNNMYLLQPPPPMAGPVMGYFTIGDALEAVRAALPPFEPEPVAQPDNMVPLVPLDQSGVEPAPPQAQ